MKGKLSTQSAFNSCDHFPIPVSDPFSYNHTHVSLQKDEDAVFSARPKKQRPEDFPKLIKNPSLKSFKSEVDGVSSKIDYEADSSPMSVKKPSKTTSFICIVRMTDNPQSPTFKVAVQSIKDASINGTLIP